ncbi:hypothetical protein [Methanoculleus sp. UBA303]|jgi:hypothetical protein|uniref:hypothetical protein n=1 Tax=Methanoculleus sp. UBA303 TaxID=1915497 RepID=UPI0025FF91A0|nr:hypothetical protein [Methanoculleus sp. UBA303]
MGIENIPVKFTVFISPPELVLDCGRSNPPDRTGSYAQSPENCPAKVTSLDALTQYFAKVPRKPLLRSNR